jgi:chromosome segregation ATPase
MRQQDSWESLLREQKRSIHENSRHESDGSMTSTMPSPDVKGSNSSSSSLVDAAGDADSCQASVPGDETSEEVRQLREIKANYEEQLGLYAERDSRNKETIRDLRDANHNLKRQLEDLKQNNQGAVIMNLEEEVSKWEALYAETAEMGAARMQRLEDELEELRMSSATNESATVESKEKMESVCKKLVATMEDMQSKEKEFDDYKRKTTERITMLTEMLEYAKAEKDKEADQLKRTQLQEYALMEKIEDLEAEIQAKAAIIERERNQSTKREARLKEQIRRGQYSDPRALGGKSQYPRGIELLDHACTSFAIALDGTLNWCGPLTADLDVGKSGRTTASE